MTDNLDRETAETLAWAERVAASHERSGNQGTASCIRKLLSLIRAPAVEAEVVEKARRIVEAAERPLSKKRPTIDELERILQQPDGPPIIINPDGSIGAGTNDALVVARALLSLTSSAPASEG